MLLLLLWLAGVRQPHSGMKGLSRLQILAQVLPEQVLALRIRAQEEALLASQYFERLSLAVDFFFPAEEQEPDLQHRLEQQQAL